MKSVGVQPSGPLRGVLLLPSLLREHAWGVKRSIEVFKTVYTTTLQLQISRLNPACGTAIFEDHQMMGSPNNSSTRLQPGPRSWS